MDRKRGVSKTWYSYDDMRRVLWTAQKLNFELGNNTVYKSLNYDTSGIHTWYISDEGGKTVRIYEKKIAPQPPTGGATPPAGGWGAKEETPLYGMSRIGMLSKVFDEQLCVKQDYIYEVKDHLGNVRVTYNEVPQFEDKTYTMTAETEQHYLADRDDYLNFANTNYWRSIDKSRTGKFSLKVSPVDNQPMPQPQKVSMFRLPIRKGEKWSAKVWAFKALNPGIAGQKIPTTVAPPQPSPKGRAKNRAFACYTNNYS